ncbi:hypothetical protein LUQ84_002999 [Hamiltosporidium tvaerminnensis]|nr:hypothetical protein LUQ84_002999 [Hamiltosporidium tvaerminnensis]
MKKNGSVLNKTLLFTDSSQYPRVIVSLPPLVDINEEIAVKTVRTMETHSNTSSIFVQDDISFTPNHSQNDSTRLRLKRKWQTSEEVDEHMEFKHLSAIKLAHIIVETGIGEAIPCDNLTNKKNPVDIFYSKIYKYANSAEIKCSNYIFFIAKSKELYSEIYFGFQTIFPEDNTVRENNENSITRGNYEEIISKEIEEFGFGAISTDKKVNEVFIFAINLKNFEETYLSNLRSDEISNVTKKIAETMSIIQKHKNLGIFYELIKFLIYYQGNIPNYIEKDCNLYFYFILSVISKQLRYFDGFQSLKYKKCLFSREKCGNDTRDLYLKKFYVQKLFSKLLLGIKNGTMRAKFYNIYISHILTSKTHHNHRLFNQNRTFNFYLRIFISIVLCCEFEPDNSMLKNWVKLSLDIFTGKKALKNFFNDKLKLLIVGGNI